MTVLLTNALQIFHVNLQELYPLLNYLPYRKCHCYRLRLLKLLEMINICVQTVLNTVKQ